MIARFGGLLDAVRTNCHISDARHARSMTLCTYLLEMRELYRWEQGDALTASLPRAAVGAWLADREALWSAYEHQSYRPLPLAVGEVDPFDTDAANRELLPEGLVYGAGVGRFGKPQFFIGTLEREERREGIRVLVAQREYARDLAPAPAALRAGTIYVRLDALRRLLWERAEAWQRRRPDGPLARALDAYGFAADPAAALEAMAAAEAETLILHELGEARAACELSPDWERMLEGFGSRRAELFARAIRDHLADCTTTLPTLIERDAHASLDLWLAGFDGLRRTLFPRLASAFESWRGGDAGALKATVAAGRAHWRDVCARVLATYRSGAASAESRIEALATADGTAL
jgi:hypothetical protein